MNVTTTSPQIKGSVPVRSPDDAVLASAALELAGVGVWYVPLDGGPPRWSTAIFEMLDEAPGTRQPDSARFDRTIHPDDFTAVRHARRTCIRNEVPYEVLYRLCIGRKIKRILERGTLCRDEAGIPYQLRAVQSMVSAADCERECALAAPSPPDLHTSEDTIRRLAAIVQASPHYIGYSDLEARIQFVNDAGLQMFGLPGEDVKGRYTQDFFEEPDRGFFSQRVLPNVLSEGRWTGDIAIRNQSTGADTRVHGIVFRIDDEVTGEPLHLAAVAQDVTELRRAEAQLAAANDKLQTVLVSCPVVLWSADLNGDLRLVQGHDMTGGISPPESLIGVNVFERFAHEADLIAGFRQALAGAQVEAEGHVGNRIFQVLMTPVRTTEGTVSSVTGVSIDITDSRSAQRELAKAYALIRGIMAAIHDNVYVTDETFRLRWWNPRVEEVLGMNAEQLIGREILEFLDTADTPRIQAAFKQAMQEGSAQVEANVRLACGPVPHHHVLVRMHDENGEVTGLCGVARDATELIRDRDELERLVKSRTQELDAARLKAEAAADAKSEFLSRMSHELRTPLNAILGFAQLLNSDLEEPLTAGQRDSMSFVETAGRHLLALINEVLDLSRYEREAPLIHIESVDLRHEVQACVALLRPLAQVRGIGIFVPIGECAVRADVTRLRQVLINLLSNAIKYNRPQGEVRFEWRNTCSDRCQLLVTDTGPGIPASAMPRLFEPFVRLPPHAQSVEGTGMGLAVAKMLIEQMNGCIGVTSDDGAGATFWIELPTVEAAAQQMPGDALPISTTEAVNPNLKEHA